MVTPKVLSSRCRVLLKEVPDNVSGEKVMVHETTYVTGIPSCVRVHVAASNLSIQLSGHVSQKVRFGPFGTKRSLNHADTTWIE